MKTGDWVWYDNEAYKVLDIDGDEAKINPIEYETGISSITVPVGELEAMTEDDVKTTSEHHRYMGRRW